MSNEPNITLPLGLRQLKEEYDYITGLEKEHNDRVNRLREQFYAKVHLKVKVDKIEQSTIARALSVMPSLVSRWVNVKGGTK